MVRKSFEENISAMVIGGHRSCCARAASETVGVSKEFSGVFRSISSISHGFLPAVAYGTDRGERIGAHLAEMQAVGFHHLFVLKDESIQQE